MSNGKKKLPVKVKDPELIKYFYLDLSIDELVDKMQNIKIVLNNSQTDVPFDAQVKDFKSASDEEGNTWIVKKIESAEVLIHKLQEIAFYIDFLLDTLAAPSILKNINNTFYRATKVVKKATNISGYNYLVEPYRKVLTNDLVNRWLFFDEDRNPNNYMVIHNSKMEPFVVAIDYNKADLLSEELKITGNDKEFGWFRQEKTRFLTLLKPANFENLNIGNFEYRLSSLMSVSCNKIKDISQKVLTGFVSDPEVKAELVCKNFEMRRKYINEYFRRWFKDTVLEKDKDNSEYSAFGQSFLKMHQDKK